MSIIKMLTMQHTPGTHTWSRVCTVMYRKQGESKSLLLKEVSFQVSVNNKNNKSGFKEPSSNQKPLKTLYNDGKKKERKSEKNNVKMI